MSSSRYLPEAAFWGWACAAIVSAGCGSLPLPPPVAPPEADFVEVTAPPPPARTEIVTAEPAGARFWVDGSWMWEGSRWKWLAGGWFAPAPGVQYVDWRVKRREDGTLLYANAMWLDARGTPIAAPAPLSKSPALGGSDVEKPPPMGEGADQKPAPPGQPTEPPKSGQVLGSDNNKSDGKKP